MKVLVYPHAMEIGGSQLNAVEAMEFVLDKVASAGKGNPMLSSAMKAATSQTPYIAMSCVNSSVTAAEPSNRF